jgi:hypothetical protein
MWGPGPGQETVQSLSDGSGMNMGKVENKNVTSAQCHPSKWLEHQEAGWKEGDIESSGRTMSALQK